MDHMIEFFRKHFILMFGESINNWSLGVKSANAGWELHTLWPDDCDGFRRAANQISDLVQEHWPRARHQFESSVRQHCSKRMGREIWCDAHSWSAEQRPDEFFFSLSLWVWCNHDNHRTRPPIPAARTKTCSLQTRCPQLFFFSDRFSESALSQLLKNCLWILTFVKICLRTRDMLGSSCYLRNAVTSHGAVKS